MLRLCTGTGVTVALLPTGANPAHHFYAGLLRPPAPSFLEAILLALGGNLPDGRRRYDEIVLALAGRDHDENGRDKPPAELFSPHGGKEPLNGRWSTLWFRRPESVHTPREESQPTRPDPLALGRHSRRWEILRSPEWTEAGETVGRFPLQVRWTRTGAMFPDRVEDVMAILRQLCERIHRSLLVVEAAVLDLPIPTEIPEGYCALSEEAWRKLALLPDWVQTS